MSYLTVWLFEVCNVIIPGQHTNLGRLFRSFTIGILICILKRNGYILRCLVVIKNIYLNYTDVRARRAPRGGGKGVRKIDKVPTLCVFLELLGLLGVQNFSVFPNL